MSYEQQPPAPGGYPQRPYQQGPAQPPGYGQPPHFPQTPPKRPWYAKKRWWILGGVLAVIIVAAVAGGGAKEDGGNTDDDPAGESTGGQDVYAVGQTAHSGDSDITVHTVTDPYTDPAGFLSPPPGQRFVGVEVSITNPTDELLTWSSLLQAELMDSQGRPWNITIAGTELPQLDGDIPIQGERRGWLFFSVGQDATGLQLRVKGNITATGSLFQL